MPLLQDKGRRRLDPDDELGVAEAEALEYPPARPPRRRQAPLAAGAEVNAKAEAAVPIDGAVMGGSAAMVRLLLEHGADPSLPDYKGRGARRWLRTWGRRDLAERFD